MKEKNQLKIGWVSVIIRTKNRPELLQRAIQSVAKQTYSPLELVVINDGGDDCQHLVEQQATGAVQALYYQKIPQSSGRAHAANSGLDHCQGEFIIFLDDDDWFLAEHIENLVTCLQKQTSFIAAYSNVCCVSWQDNQWKLLHRFDEVFDRQRLAYENYFPIHAILFRHQALTPDCRFNESFDKFEDWSFWLKLTQQGNFFHCHQDTAYYRITEQGNDGLSMDYRLQFDEQLEDYISWARYQWSLEQVLGLVKNSFLLKEQANQYHRDIATFQKQVDKLNDKLQLQQQLYERHDAKAKRENKLLNEQIQQLKLALQLTQQENQHLLQSHSWKITAPLRFIKIWGRRLVRFIHSLFILLQTPSLIKPTLQKAWQAFKLQGWRGAGLIFKRFLKGTEPFDNTGRWYNYQQHIQQYQKRWLADIDLWQNLPKISVILPTYNTAEKILQATIDSVFDQIYPHWELLIVDDGSDQPHVIPTIQKFCQRDDRIILLQGQSNKGVSNACNRAIEVAQGDFIAFLDHDDLLEPHALFRLAECIFRDDPDLVYSDEVLIDENNNEVIDFIFRPAFSLELLRSHPYIVHMLAVRTSLVKEIGGFDESLTVCQDYDLILKICERSKNIVHIPELLYCWRQLPTSSGHRQQQKVSQTSQEVLQAHLDRCHQKAQVKVREVFNYYSIDYLLDLTLKIAIIIPTKNHANLVRQCIESIEKTVLKLNYHIILVDHQSTDTDSIDYFQFLSEHQKNCTVLNYQGDFNFSLINNFAVSQLDCSFTHFLFCNNDIEAINPGWLEYMAQLAQQADIGIVGATLLYPDGIRIQHGGVTVGLFGIAEHNGKFMSFLQPDGEICQGYRGALYVNHEVSAVTAACLLMRRDVFAAIDGFDKALAVGFGDVDLCLRAGQAGYRVIHCSQAILLHHESYTRGKSSEDPHPTDSALFKQRWQHIIKVGDPFFNPNFDHHATDWLFRSPLVLNPEYHRRKTRLDRLKTELIEF